jgi:hypothetical protein
MSLANPDFFSILSAFQRPDDLSNSSLVSTVFGKKYSILLILHPILDSFPKIIFLTYSLCFAENKQSTREKQNDLFIMIL